MSLLLWEHVVSLVHEFDSFAFVLRTGLVACVFDPSAFYICSIYLILVCCASTLCLLYTSLTHLRLALGVVIVYRSRCVCVWWSERVRSCFACFDVSPLRTSKDPLRTPFKDPFDFPVRVCV